jgi:hypothetical protein
MSALTFAPDDAPTIPLHAVSNGRARDMALGAGAASSRLGGDDRIRGRRRTASRRPRRCGTTRGSGGRDRIREGRGARALCVGEGARRAARRRLSARRRAYGRRAGGGGARLAARGLSLHALQGRVAAEGADRRAARGRSCAARDDRGRRGADARPDQHAGLRHGTGRARGGGGAPRARIRRVRRRDAGRRPSGGEPADDPCGGPRLAALRRG